MTNITPLQIVKFHDDVIETILHGGVPHVVMRRIVENLGLNWGSQAKKIREQREKYSCTDLYTTASDGKNYEMLCIPDEKLPIWLASINPTKIPNEATREKFDLYQAECAIALHDYWTKGAATRPNYEPPADITDLETRSLIKALTDAAYVRQEQAKLAAHQAEHDQRLLRIEAKQSAIENGASMFTVLGFMSFRGIPISLSSASQVGKEASALSKSRGMPIEKVKDPRFGYVNAYHETVLSEVVTSMLG